MKDKKAATTTAAAAALLLLMGHKIVQNNHYVITRNIVFQRMFDVEIYFVFKYRLSENFPQFIKNDTLVLSLKRL